jgi:hypothetical protein
MKIPFSVASAVSILLLGLMLIGMKLTSLPSVVYIVGFAAIILVGVIAGVIAKPGLKDVFETPFLVMLALLILAYFSAASFVSVSWLNLIIAGLVCDLALWFLTPASMLGGPGQAVRVFAAGLISGFMMQGFSGVLLSLIASILALVPFTLGIPLITLTFVAFKLIFSYIIPWMFPWLGLQMFG